MKRILIVTQYIYPEIFKSSDIAFELAKRGYQVDVLTGIPNYPKGVYFEGYGLFKKRFEKVDNVRFYRCFQSPRGRKASAIGLSLNYITFVFSAYFWILFFFAWKKKYDVILTHEPSPITQILPAILLSKLKGIPVYSWIMDIWPDSMVDAVSPNLSRILTPILTFITEYVYKKSHKLLITSKGMARFINRNTDYSSKIEYFPNWSVDLNMSHNMKAGDFVEGVKLPELPDGFIIMLAGNLGKAQNLDAIAKCILKLKHISELKWVFVGDGSEKKWLDKFIQENNLEYIAFALGRYPLESMPYFYSKANAMLVTLKSDLDYLNVTVPARLQSYMAAGKPIIAMLGEGGFDIINEADCGYVVSPGDYNALASMIEDKVLNDRIEFEKKGMNGRLFFEKEFKLEICIDHLERIINKNYKVSNSF